MVQEKSKFRWSLDYFQLFRSPKNRSFRLFFMGQGFSLIGAWMQMTALAWLVWRLSHSAMLLGFFGFASRIPTFVMAPFAGVLVDRMNRHRLILLTQVLSMIQALLLLPGPGSAWPVHPTRNCCRFLPSRFFTAMPARKVF
jgi:MFS family permease